MLARRSASASWATDVLPHVRREERGAYLRSLWASGVVVAASVSILLIHPIIAISSGFPAGAVCWVHLRDYVTLFGRHNWNVRVFFGYFVLQSILMGLFLAVLVLEHRRWISSGKMSQWMRLVPLVGTIALDSYIVYSQPFALPASFFMPLHAYLAYDWVARHKGQKGGET